MSTQAPFALRGRNPDVLTSIANLSNDEVFTPPEFANRMLDTLAEAWAESNDGANIWADSSVTFLDPFTKSGVFLREITKRLVDGLVGEIPNLQDRVNHVLTKQIFGIGITELTSLLARRSVYCSKWANGEHSICTAFDSEQGNIWFERTEHTWVGGTEKVITMDENGEAVLKPTNGKCKFCGANQKEYDRDDVLESHAYAFIHTNDIKTRMAELFGEEMKFDVIIGNPPYQLSDGGHSASAAPIYHHFVEQAKLLEPNFLMMVIPARWYTGGKGLDSFRDVMLRDGRIASIDDFPTSSTVFPSVEIKGGVCYFVWERSHSGSTKVRMHHGPETVSEALRPLLENGLNFFVRYNEAVPVLKKVIEYRNQLGKTREASESSAPPFAELVSARKPFGISTNFRGHLSQGSNDVLIYQNGGQAYVDREQLTTNLDWVDQWKVLVPYAYGSGNAYPFPIEQSNPILAPPGTAATETYLVIGPFQSEEIANNAIAVLRTKMVRFLIMLRKSTQHATRSVYELIPPLDLSVSWTDSMLFELLGISDSEIAYIDSLIATKGEAK